MILNLTLSPDALADSLRKRNCISCIYLLLAGLLCIFNDIFASLTAKRIAIKAILTDIHLNKTSCCPRVF